LKENNIDIVRRLTGGRGLLHDKELTYSIVTPISSLKCGDSVVNSYKEISQFLINGFKKLDIKLEFPTNKKPNTKFDYCMLISTGADLCYNGKKFVGSAQFRKEGYILQHGSILLDYNTELIQKIFGENPNENSLTSLKEINPKITLEDLLEVFKTISF
jgi:lipoate-protein ligase A